MDILTVALQSALRHRDHLRAVLAVQLQNPILSRAASRTEEQLFMVSRVIDDLAIQMSAKVPPTGIQLIYAASSIAPGEDSVNCGSSQALYSLSRCKAYAPLW